MKVYKWSACILLFLGMDIQGYPQILTTAEKTDFASTSTYDEVMNFFDELKKASPFIRLDSIAISAEGRRIPLAILGNPMPGSAEDMITDDRLVIYFQANIHAGEVEGKEAVQMLARDLLENPDHEIFKNIILLICPIP
ncbi:MAG: hypothetical protein FJY07_12080, partial [Bacteroidetes bacterium]|nr:hypothetical protein [Bacteroidota bacterium]